MSLLEFFVILSFQVQSPFASTAELAKQKWLELIPEMNKRVSRGIIREQDELLIGPDLSGQFVPVRVGSIHRNKAPCRVVKAGQAASLALTTECELEVRKVSDALDQWVFWMASSFGLVIGS